ncbi:DUF2357 domain-containing protein [Lysinibacillus sp. FW12]|uniref:DUF2357 domain-containing protein n=1 Tax=Lysinibacillus sp. FW12 TaxID=3096079 RepID=UPI003D71B817
MDTPCSLVFIHSPSKEYRKEKKVSVFVDNKESIFSIPEDKIVEVTENVDLSVLFICSSSAKFYMDGLDMLPESQVESDNLGDVYLPSSPTEQILFANGEQNGYTYYPLIPGFYQVKVEIEDKLYYTLLRVKPKQVTEEQWETMRKEIEDTLQGLAQDLVRKNLNLTSEEDVPIPITYMRQWLLLRNEKSRLLNAIEEIQKAPRYQIVKDYEIVPDALAKHIGEETIKFRSQHPDKKDVIKEAKSVISYNLPENRWMLHIVQTLATTTQTLYQFLLSYEDVLNREMKELRRWGKKAEGRIRIKEKVSNQIQEMKRDANQFRSAWSRWLHAPWVQNFPKTFLQEIPMAISADSRYRILYQVYRNLKKDNTSVTLDPIYTYHWKRTDYLYEIWGFIQVIRVFLSEEMGFSATKGWLFDIADVENGITVPELRKGSYVELTDGTLRVRVIYEEELPSSAEDTGIENPLYTSSHHRLPDCRIDVYDEHGHIGSLLLDFKYRPLSSIWNKQLIKTSKQTKTMKQLDAYTTACRSPWFLKGRAMSRILNRFRPVAEVWPIFPYKVDKERRRDVDEYFVRPMDLTPGKENHHFKKHILEAIEEMKMIVQDITK